MLKVKILKPVDGYEVGDTPEMTGNRFRELEASGHVERIEQDGNLSAAADISAPARSARKPRAKK